MKREEYMQKIFEQVVESHGCAGQITKVIAVIALALILMSSCATKTKIEYRDRDVNHYITNTVRDTLVEKSTDSVYFSVIQKGDTVFATKYKEVTKWRDRVVEKHDTCWRDSVVTEYKENVTEKTKIPKIFWISMCFSILVIIFAIIKVVRWLQLR